MNYHGITLTSFNNGEGMRTVLWVAGCEHKCKGCQNTYSWDVSGGKPFDTTARLELFKALNRTWIDGLTFSGGDPLHPANREAVTTLARDFKAEFPRKNIWLYTGYTYEDIKDLEVMKYVDVVVDGKFIEELTDSDYAYAGSTNQRIIRLTQEV